MPKVHRSLDRRYEYQWNEAGQHTEYGPDFAKFTMPLEETYRLALAWVDAYPMIRAAFVKKYPDQADTDDELEDEDYQALLNSVGLKEREQVEAREQQVEEFTRLPSKQDEHMQPERLELP